MVREGSQNYIELYANAPKYRDFQKPTAQSYYRNLISATKIDATWNLIRYKVRHLKNGWQKAETYRKSAGDEMEEGDALRAKLIKICPHYDQLNSIFSGGNKIEVIVCDSQGSQGSIVLTNDMPQYEEESTINPPITMDDFPDAEFLEKANEETENCYITELMSMEASRTKFRQDRLKLERETLKLQREQFLFAKEVEERKLKLEERRIENDFKLKQLELEQKERILKLELELKYREQQ
ncbi:uncharacterized protein LOC117791362 isoform X2 [Drosophila innubila]|uniref:uncharacterized protein LOC117791362 isoform X2 n=1 Tax=Drosophila innubila TaxID=198719 RepID=UPI00148BC7E9|nr:uncharacterized protein LOC117791362 isoform X2 [Drosophila innubila]